MGINIEIRVNSLVEEAAFPCPLDAGMAYPMVMGGEVLEMKWILAGPTLLVVGGGDGLPAASTQPLD
jgi:hypothetical protein